MRSKSALAPLTLAAKRGVPSDWILKETGRRWHEATHASIRVSFSGPIKAGKKHTFEEIRLTPSTFVIEKKALQLASNIWEPGFTLCRILAVIDRRTIVHSIQPIVEVSLGALSDLALFGSLSIAEAISTLSEYHWWTSVLQATCRRQVILPTQEGFWRAFTAEVGSHGIGAIPLVALYGWSADTEIIKDRTRQILRQFRETGWDHSMSADLVCKLTNHVLDQVS